MPRDVPRALPANAFPVDEAENVVIRSKGYCWARGPRGWLRVELIEPAAHDRRIIAGSVLVGIGIALVIAAAFAAMVAGVFDPWGWLAVACALVLILVGGLVLTRLRRRVIVALSDDHMGPEVAAITRMAGLPRLLELP